MAQVLKLIILFYNMGKAYAREVAAGGGVRTVYSTDGNGHVTITVEEV
jgi:hypothetical protein